MEGDRSEEVRDSADRPGQTGTARGWSGRYIAGLRTVLPEPPNRLIPRLTPLARPTLTTSSFGRSPSKVGEVGLFCLLGPPLPFPWRQDPVGIDGTLETMKEGIPGGLSYLAAVIQRMHCMRRGAPLHPRPVNRVGLPEGSIVLALEEIGFVDHPSSSELAKGKLSFRHVPIHRGDRDTEELAGLID